MRKVNVEDRFFTKVQITPGCWNWRAATWGNNGYGCVKVGGVTRSAHRVAYEMLVGPSPQGLVVMHRCDNPLCVNPDHLLIGTQAQNVQDAAMKGRQSNSHRGASLCKRGHEFTPDNTRLVKGGRQCRTCDGIRRAIAEGKAKDKWERKTCGK